MTVADYLSAGLLTVAIGFFVAGTIGLFRFPDLYSRLHALTKADNVGLGLTVAALMLQADSWQTITKLALIWVMVSVASANVCILIAGESLRRGRKAWTRT